MMNPAEPDARPQSTLWMLDLGQPLPVGPIVQVPVVSEVLMSVGRFPLEETAFTPHFVSVRAGNPSRGGARGSGQESGKSGQTAGRRR
jgi:hypothetical protein